jgi:hypothetical protein
LEGELDSHGGAKAAAKMRGSSAAISRNQEKSIGENKSLISNED